MLRRPCEVCRITSGSTPISVPTLHGTHLGLVSWFRPWNGAWTGPYECQCFTTAAVESMIVPSMSKRKPWNETWTAGALNWLAIIVSKVPSCPLWVGIYLRECFSSRWRRPLLLCPLL